MAEVVLYRFQPDAMEKEMLDRLLIGRNRRGPSQENDKRNRRCCEESNTEILFIGGFERRRENPFHHSTIP